MASGQGMFRDPVACRMQELSILDYPLVHHSAPIKAAAALLSAVSFQTKTLRPYLDEMKVLACCSSSSSSTCVVECCFRASASELEKERHNSMTC